MATGEESDWYLMMMNAKRCQARALLVEYSHGAVVKGLTNRGHPCAGMQTAEALQLWLEGSPQYAVPVNLGRLLDAGLSAGLAAGLREGYTLSRRSIAMCCASMVTNYPWTVKNVLEHGMTASMLKFWGEADKLAVELEGDGILQVDFLKRGADPELCKAYAPRYACLCREAIGLLAASLVTAIAAVRSRAEAPAALLEFACETALDVGTPTKVPRSPTDKGPFECAAALAAMLAPTLHAPDDDDDDDEKNATDKGRPVAWAAVRKKSTQQTLAPDEADRRRAVKKVKDALSGPENDKDPGAEILAATNKLLEETGRAYFVAAATALDPAAVELYGRLKAAPDPDTLAEAVETRLLTYNALFDVFASLELTTDDGIGVRDGCTRFLEQYAELPHLDPMDDEAAEKAADDAEDECLVKHGISYLDTPAGVDVLYTLPTDREAQALACRSRDAVLANDVKVRGNTLLKADKFAGAARLYRRALRLCPVDDPLRAVLYSNLAEAHLRAGAPRLALRAAKTAHRLGNDKAPKRLERAKRQLSAAAATGSDTARRCDRLHFDDDAASFIRWLEPDRPRPPAAAPDHPRDLDILQETDEDRRLFETDRVTDPMCPEITAAALNGNLRALKRCLRDGQDPNTRSMGGDTPLLIVCRYAKVDCVRVLVACGACCRTTDAWGERDALYHVLDPNNPHYQGQDGDATRAQIERLVRDGQRAQGPNPIVPPVHSGFVVDDFSPPAAAPSSSSSS